MCKHRQPCIPCMLSNYISVYCWLTVGLQCLYEKINGEIVIVNIVNHFSILYKKMMIDIQVFISEVYKVDDVDGETNIYIHAQKNQRYE